MRKRKHGLRLVSGLMAVMALGVLAFASSAQATAVILIDKKAALHATAGGVQEGSGVLLVPNLKLEVKCTGFKVNEGLILSGGTIAHVKLLYEGCTALDSSKLPAIVELPCTVSDVHAGKPELSHITVLDVLLLPIHFASGDFGVLADINSPVFINFKSGTGCPLPLKNEIKGKVCALIEPATNDTIKPLVLFSQAIQESCSDLLSYGVNDAFIDASAELFLTGEHEKHLLGVSLI